MLFFFFKQKTAYEMRISDWSSDVCSSDLLTRFADALVGLADAYRACAAALGVGPQDALDGFLETLARDAAATHAALRLLLGQPGISSQQIGRASCRERVCQYV